MHGGRDGENRKAQESNFYRQEKKKSGRGTGDGMMVEGGGRVINRSSQ